MPAITLTAPNTLASIYEKAANYRTLAAQEAADRGDTATATLNQQHATENLSLAADARAAA